MRVLLNDAELTALAGLPHLVVCLYVMAIRPRMDYDTGRVGVNPRISWHALTEWIYVEPHPGDARTGTVSKQQARRAAARLVDAGLLKMQSSEVHRMLVFQCVLADRNSHVRKKADTKPTHQADTPLPRENTVKPTQGEQQKPTHTGDTEITVSNTTTTKVLAVAGGGGDLIWPENLTGNERQAIQGLIDRHKLNGSSQLMLDELAGAMQTKQIVSRVSYARALIYSMKAGTFTAEKAHQVADARAARQRQIEREAQSSRTPDATPEERARGRAMLDNIRSNMKRKGAQ